MSVAWPGLQEACCQQCSRHPKGLTERDVGISAARVIQFAFTGAHLRWVVGNGSPALDKTAPGRPAWKVMRRAAREFRLAVRVGGYIHTGAHR